MIGLIGATNWRGLTDRYVDLLQFLRPIPSARRSAEDQVVRSRRYNRILFGAIGCLGVLLTATGLVELIT